MNMHVEYQMLSLMGLMFLFAFIPVSVAKAKTFGAAWLASNRDSRPQTPMPIWGERCERAHQNLKDNFPGFSVAILALGATGGFSETTKWLSVVYVAARVVHYAAYGFGNVTFRVLAYLVGLVVNCALLIKIFNA